MGTTIRLDDPVYCVDCIDAFPPDKTPCKIYAWFWGVKKGDKVGAREPANLHLFTLIQDDIEPCLWKNDPSDFGWDIQLQFWPDPVGDPFLRLWMYGTPVQPYFSYTARVIPAEHLVFDNALWPPPGAWGYDGHGIIMWLDKATDILDDFVLPTDPKMLMEFSVTDEGVPVYKFNIPKYSMNIKFKVSP